MGINLIGHRIYEKFLNIYIILELRNQTLIEAISIYVRNEHRLIDINYSSIFFIPFRSSEMSDQQKLNLCTQTAQWLLMLCVVTLLSPHHQQ